MYQPGFQCGVNMLVNFSITLQPVLTKGRDTNVGMKAHATLGLVFLQSDGANDTSESPLLIVGFPLTFPCEKGQKSSVLKSDTGISTHD